MGLAVIGSNAALIIIFPSYCYYYVLRGLKAGMVRMCVAGKTM